MPATDTSFIEACEVHAVQEIRALLDSGLGVHSSGFGRAQYCRAQRGEPNFEPEHEPRSENNEM